MNLKKPFMFVIPAKAGIQFVKCSSKKQKNLLDPGLRRDDETKENEFQLPFLGSCKNRKVFNLKTKVELPKKSPRTPLSS